MRQLDGRSQVKKLSTLVVLAGKRRLLIFDKIKTEKLNISSCARKAVLINKTC